MKKIDQSTIRAQNLTRILDVMIRERVTTRQQIAKETGLSLMTVGNLVEQIGRNGALSVVADAETGSRRRTVGRIAERLTLREALGVWLVVDLSDRDFRYSTLTLNRELAKSSASWAWNGAMDYEANLTAFLRGAAVDIGRNCAQVLGVAVVVPGPYSDETDRVCNKRVPEINQLRIKHLVREALGAHYCYVDEDVKFAARSCYEQVCPGEREILYYLYIGEGVGGAVVHDGNVVSGLNAVAGDPGQLPFGGGTFESALSLRAFAARAMDQRGAMDERAVVERLRALAADEPDRYRALLSQCVAPLAGLLTAAVWMIDPHVVALDCAYAAPFGDDLLCEVREHLAALTGGVERLPELRCLSTDVKATYTGAVKMLEKNWIGSME